MFSKGYGRCIPKKMYLRRLKLRPDSRKCSSPPVVQRKLQKARGRVAQRRNRSTLIPNVPGARRQMLGDMFLIERAKVHNSDFYNILDQGQIEVQTIIRFRVLKAKHFSSALLIHSSLRLQGQPLESRCHTSAQRSVLDPISFLIPIRHSRYRCYADRLTR